MGKGQASAEATEGGGLPVPQRRKSFSKQLSQKAGTLATSAKRSISFGKKKSRPKQEATGESVQPQPDVASTQQVVTPSALAPETPTALPVESSPARTAPPPATVPSPQKEVPLAAPVEKPPVVAAPKAVPTPMPVAPDTPSAADVAVATALTHQVIEEALAADLAQQCVEDAMAEGEAMVEEESAAEAPADVEVLQATHMAEVAQKEVAAPKSSLSLSEYVIAIVFVIFLALAAYMMWTMVIDPVEAVPVAPPKKVFLLKMPKIKLPFLKLK